MKTKEIAEKLLQVINKWEHESSVFNRDEYLIEVLNKAFDNDSIVKVYFFAIKDNSEEIIRWCLDVEGK